MHLRAILRGVLKRSNSSSTTGTRSGDSSSGADPPTTPTPPPTTGCVAVSGNDHDHNHDHDRACDHRGHDQHASTAPRSRIDASPDTAVATTTTTNTTTAAAAAAAVARFGDQHSVPDSILKEGDPDSSTAPSSDSQSLHLGHAHRQSDPQLPAELKPSTSDSSASSVVTTISPRDPPQLPEQHKHTDKLDRGHDPNSGIDLDRRADLDPPSTLPQRYGAGDNPTLLVQCPSPDYAAQLEPHQEIDEEETPVSDKPPVNSTSARLGSAATDHSAVSPGTAIPPVLASVTRPTDTNLRRQSLVNGANSSIIRTLLNPATVVRPFSPITPAPTADYFGPAAAALPADMASMLTRKIWVKRPGASATMVSIREDDLVDDVRDMILKKYANSLGRSFDSPDVTLRIVSRAENPRSRNERQLGPEEDMCRTLDQYYPGGQTVEEALVIDVPQRVRSPRPSPRPYNPNSYAALDEFRPPETGTDYFPQMPAIIPPSGPASAVAGPVHHPLIHLDQARSMSVLNTGQVPPLPSPGSTRRHREHRPKFSRQHTSSPTILSHPHPAHAGTLPLNPSNLAVTHNIPVRTANRPRGNSAASDQRLNGAPPAPPLPSPPAPEAPPTGKGSSPPTPDSREQNSLRPGRPKRSRKPTPTNGTATAGAKASPGLGKGSSLFDGSMPPINVLIVEDNIINLKLLEAFMKRLKVRWSTAMNGQIAVNKWRAGGFHLVLMDIQLPIMSGLEATKEIRRLERVNGIGVFSNSTPTSETPLRKQKSIEAGVAERDEQQKEDDKLNKDEGQFKSPVIIVALTASSLQSDRHEALAAGCNDFLTKPVNFVWLERKVSEWGCMQALIDFDGWRQWKDFASAKQDSAGKALPASAADSKTKDRKTKRVSRASLENDTKPAPAAENTGLVTTSKGTTSDAA
ncbi:hypothetical protein MBLNU459_g2149t1 [Dothideomycetes sp. NU459]